MVSYLPWSDPDFAISYGYNPAGDLGAITYGDTNTPAVASVYGRRGRRVTVTNGTQVVAFTYNDAGQLTEEYNTAGLLSGLGIRKSYDSLLRSSSVTLRDDDAFLILSENGYDNVSRLASVSDGPNGAHLATYTYLPNSSVVSNIVFRTDGTNVMTTTKSYDNLNRLTSIQSSAGVSPVSSYSYQYNSANYRWSRYRSYAGLSPALDFVVGVKIELTQMALVTTQEASRGGMPPE